MFLHYQLISVERNLLTDRNKQKNWFHDVSGQWNCYFNVIDGVSVRVVLQFPFMAVIHISFTAVYRSCHESTIFIPKWLPVCLFFKLPAQIKLQISSPWTFENELVDFEILQMYNLKCMALAKTSIMASNIFPVSRLKTLWDKRVRDLKNNSIL